MCQAIFNGGRKSNFSIKAQALQITQTLVFSSADRNRRQIGKYKKTSSSSTSPHYQSWHRIVRKISADHFMVSNTSVHQNFLLLLYILFNYLLACKTILKKIHFYNTVIKYLPPPRSGRPYKSNIPYQLFQRIAEKVIHGWTRSTAIRSDYKNGAPGKGMSLYDIHMA